MRGALELLIEALNIGFADPVVLTARENLVELIAAKPSNLDAFASTGVALRALAQNKIRSR
jgi:hypothetical protein